MTYHLVYVTIGTKSMRIDKKENLIKLQVDPTLCPIRAAEPIILALLSRDSVLVGRLSPYVTPKGRKMKIAK